MTTAIEDDPHLWLEEIDDPLALAWAGERTVETEDRFDSPERTALESRLRAVLDDPRRLVVPARHGDWMYDVWRDADHPRGLWRRCPRGAFLDGAAAWQVLVDLDALGEQEGVRWAFSGAVHGPVGSDRVLLGLSPDGGDARVLREFDLALAAFVDDASEPFTLAVDKSRVAWLDADTLLVASSVAGGRVTDSGYPATVRVWTRGAPLTAARTLAEAEQTDVGAFVQADRHGDRVAGIVNLARDFFNSDVFVWQPGVDAEPRRIAAPPDAHVDVHADLVVVRTTTEWEVGGRAHPGGTLLVGPLDTLTHGDGSALRVAFAPTATTVLESWSWTASRLVLTLLENVTSRIVSIDPASPALACDIDVRVGDDLLSIDVATTDADVDDELLLVARGFLTPSTLLTADAVTGESRIVDSAPAVFDSTGLVARQHWAISADGTRVPYFQVGPEDADVERAVLMSGYGGFEHALTPEYPTLVGPAWLERGGVFVVAGIRGGGEFGPSWHRAALRENRHRAYEDFAAVARDLVARDVAPADRIGCHGRSNGGLLVGNMLTTYPDDFGAVVCGVPLLDMRRYTRLSAGASWIAEYGDPDDPHDWEFIRTFSPYHLVDGSRRYPPSLIYAATSDDRVGPVQARKMAARLRDETDAVVHYLEPAEGGHAGTIDNTATAALHATIHAFLADVLRL